MSGYGPKNGAREAPVHRQSGSGSTLGEDFPMICETCLGTNPYLRMTKKPFGDKLCKISNVPYQGFKWKAGPQGRYKETIICYTVAAERNICQTCLNDMKFGLPVGVRDALLAKSENQIALPTSIVGQMYYYQNQAEQAGSGNNTLTIANELANTVPNRQLDKFSRMQQVVAAKSKTAFRNLPKLCSFWLNGTCARVVRGTCPFRPCCGKDAYVFPEIAGSAKEIHTELIGLLHAEGPAAVMKKISPETKAAFRAALSGNKDDAIRKRVSGDDDLSKKYLNNMKQMNLELPVPEDKSICTLWLGNIEPQWTEDEIREVIYPFGVITSIVLIKQSRCAFIEYVDRETAEYAANQMYNALLIQGRPITVNWAKPKTQVNEQSHLSSSKQQGSGPGGLTPMLAPPGMESAPVSAYALQNMPVPVLAPMLSGIVRPREEANEGEEDDGNALQKRQAVDTTVPPPPPPLLQFNANSNSSSGSVPFRPPPPRAPYPSMNPTRMGSSL